MTDFMNTDYRQRFFMSDSPVRGDVVKLTDTYQSVINQKHYPIALQKLLGQMLVSASLLIGTLKIEGRLSIQLQSDGNTLLDWAMAECDHTGLLRALADFKPSPDWHHMTQADDAFAQINGVLFINIHGHETYQGIVERVADNLGDCLAHYQKQSVQIATLIRLSANEQTASGILVQLLPQTDDDKTLDPDLWNRVSLLASTLKPSELESLNAEQILYRLYHEEEVVLDEPYALAFGCTCSKQKSQNAIINLGKQEAMQVFEDSDTLSLDCGFCGAVYHFDQQAVQALFA